MRVFAWINFLDSINEDILRVLIFKLNISFYNSSGVSNSKKKKLISTKAKKFLNRNTFEK